MRGERRDVCPLIRNTKLINCDRKSRSDARWDAGSCQHFGLHGVEAFTLADAQLDLDSVVGVILEEETVVDDELCVGSCAIEDVDLQKGHRRPLRHK